MLEDFRLKVFVTVAQEGSFTKAAARLNISQPAVSQHISELERTTGVKLFERLRGEVVLTEQGRIFQIHAKRILAAYVSASSLFGALENTVVRIKASDEVYSYMVNVLNQYLTLHPELQFTRTDEEDAELILTMLPTPRHFGMQENMGDISASHNIIMPLLLNISPSETFAQTKTWLALKDFLK